MIMLTQPLTIEDWFGNFYLIKPSSIKYNLPELDNQSTVTFKKPKLFERNSKMIKRIMVATTIDRESISSLLRSLKKQLDVDLNVDNLTVWKLSSKQARGIHNKNIKNRKLKNKICQDTDKNENGIIKKVKNFNDNWNKYTENSLLKNLGDTIPCDFSIELEKSYSDNHQSSSDELYMNPLDEFKLKSAPNNSILPDINRVNNKRQIVSQRERFTSTKKHLYHTTTSISSINRNQKFAFYICWHANLSGNKNYFILPKDKFTGLSHEISESDQYLLTRSLKMIENTADSQIRYKTIMQSRRIQFLFYRKVIIYAHDRHAIWISLQLLKKYLVDVIRNAVFYESSLTNSSVISSQCFMDLKNEHSMLKFATEQCFEDIQSPCKSISKVSKIPVLLASQRFPRTAKKFLKAHEKKSIYLKI